MELGVERSFNRNLRSKLSGNLWQPISSPFPARTSLYIKPLLVVTTSASFPFAARKATPVQNVDVASQSFVDVMNTEYRSFCSPSAVLPARTVQRDRTPQMSSRRIEDLAMVLLFGTERSETEGAREIVQQKVCVVFCSILRIRLTNKIFRNNGYYL